jgi:uncharacterized protein YidB (DUF937 family)
MGIGAGVAVAVTRQSPSSSSSSTTKETALGRNAFLDDVAKRLGVQRSKVVAALQAQALDNVKWAEDNGFITRAQADALRQRIRAGLDGEFRRFGFENRSHLGHRFGFDDRFGPGLPLRGFPPPAGRFSLAGGPFGLHAGHGLATAADYLGMTPADLSDALNSKTLAQVARDRGRPVAGLEQALRSARAARLDEAVAEGDITVDQREVLLRRFDADIDSVVNGVPPALSDLAGRLGVQPSKLIAAIKGARIDQVDNARAQGLITKAQADAIKQRIQSSPAPGLGGLGLCDGPGHVGFGLGVDLSRAPLAADIASI